MPEGKVYLVGAGPGDAGLVTLRAKQLISGCDVLVYDALANPQLLEWTKPDCELVNAGKRSNNHVLSQSDTNELLLKLAREGKKVVRLKGGDPLVFGRGGEEGAYLHQAGVAFEIVPGISSAIAGLCYAGIPVTHRAHCTMFSVMTGHEQPDKAGNMDFSLIAAQPGTKVILMGMERLELIVEGLLQGGMPEDTPAAVVQWATTPMQRSVVSDLAGLPQAVKQQGLGAPALIVVGSVVKERENLNWFESRPLFGRSIIVTRTREQSGELSNRLGELGAQVIEMPTISIAEPSDVKEFMQSVADCHSYDWLLFSSANGVERFFAAFFKIFRDIRSIGGARIAAVGPATAAKLKQYGLAVDVMPEKDYTAEGLVQALKKAKSKFGDLAHQTFLWVRPEQARDVLAEGLGKEQAIVDLCLAYSNKPVKIELDGALAKQAQTADWITFTSASTVHNFMASGLQLAATTKIASIGPITSKALAEYALKPHVEAQSASIEGLIEALIAAGER